MNHECVVIQVGNQATNKQGFLKYLQTGSNGESEYALTDSFQEAILYSMADGKDESSVLNLHMQTLSSEFPRLELDVLVLTVQATPYYAYEG